MPRYSGHDESAEMSAAHRTGLLIIAALGALLAAGLCLVGFGLG